MAGLYLHIPFCRKACHYCDFHFSTQLSAQKDFVAALIQEMKNRRDASSYIETIYFGGGTPSTLSYESLQEIFQHLYQNFNIANQAEITFEVNPEDINTYFLQQLKTLGINRLSIGIQSFRTSDLIRMNRSHTPEQGIGAVKMAQDKGFENISLDLMYGLPELSRQDWQKNLATMFALDIPHFSAYCLTIEEKTAWKTLVAKKKIPLTAESLVLEHWQILLVEAEKNHFIQYEISNFAKNQQYSKHNLSYWQNKKYIGLGPSAHSFDGKTRSWNVANNALYIKNINENIPIYESEILTIENQMNERILTTLRTMWGISLVSFQKDFGAARFQELIKKSAQWQNKQDVVITNNHLKLSETGKIKADYITADLFFQAY
jgi:oxygen-independent coproporphyrinogen-3 oxidase